MLGPEAMTRHAVPKAPKGMSAAVAVLALALQASAAAAAPSRENALDAIGLFVDATDTIHRVYRVREEIPVSGGGALTLRYPEWEPASHAPTAWAGALGGLRVSAGQRSLPWQRDAVDMHSFHLQVPERVRRIQVEFEFLSPLSPGQGPAAMADGIVTIPWQRVLLYPATSTKHVYVDASFALPSDMQPISALNLRQTAPASWRADRVSLDDLVDAPVYAGEAVRQIRLSNAGPEVRLALVAAKATPVDMPTTLIEPMQAMLAQASRILAGHPFDRYTFIVALSDDLPGPGGIEHRRSSENVVPTSFLEDWAHQLVYRDLFAHEYVHAWNGLAHRLVGHRVPDFNTRVGNDLLWVYEGQTEFWGRVLAARAGLRSQQDTLDALALDAATALSHVGRHWRPLQDSTNDPVISAGHAVAWRDWQRREDYYGEGVLLWLAVDAELRERSAGKRGLDDFARIFFRSRPQGAAHFYRFADVATVLGQLAPADWGTRLRQWLDTTQDAVLLDGLAKSGYDLTFSEVPTACFLQAEADAGVTDLTWSIGLSANASGVLKSVAWEGPAFAAGLNPGDRLVEVDDEPYTAERLTDAVRRASSAPIRLAIRSRNQTRKVAIAYRGTLRYPRLVRRIGSVDRLTPLLNPVP